MNLALGHPTWQSSVYSHKFAEYFDSWRAVDGNNGSCMRTDVDGRTPWWAVDLSGLYIVQGVNLTTGRDYGDRYGDNFVVGLSNISPNESSPMTAGYTVCGQWPGVAPRGATTHVQCAANQPPFRYVIILAEDDPLMRMDFCELEVYGEDANECASNNGGCSVNARCNNSVGSYTCTCNTGFKGNGFDCSDFDECASNAGRCHANASCVNTHGSFRCFCLDGFTGNGLSCEGSIVASSSGSVTSSNGALSIAAIVLSCIAITAFVITATMIIIRPSHGKSSTADNRQPQSVAVESASRRVIVDTALYETPTASGGDENTYEKM